MERVALSYMDTTSQASPSPKVGDSHGSSSTFSPHSTQDPVLCPSRVPP